MVFNYANLNDDNICIGVSILSGKVDNEKMIRILKYDESLLGQRWNGEAFEAVPEPEEEITEEAAEDAAILHD